MLREIILSGLSRITAEPGDLIRYSRYQHDSIKYTYGTVLSADTVKAQNPVLADMGPGRKDVCAHWALSEKANGSSEFPEGYWHAVGMMPLEDCEIYDFANSVWVSTGTLDLS